MEQTRAPSPCSDAPNVPAPTERKCDRPRKSLQQGLTTALLPRRSANSETLVRARSRATRPRRGWRAGPSRLRSESLSSGPPLPPPTASRLTLDRQFVLLDTRLAGWLALDGDLVRAKPCRHAF